MKPVIYYLEVVDKKNGKLKVKVTDKPETLVPYRSMTIIDKDGNLHVFFWKKENKEE
ncbi:MAG TPA: hypothetical protein VF837_04530 [Patescibacteria group bacterium]